MLGDIGFLLNGNMLVGVWKNSLIVRLGEEALLEPHVRPFDIPGKPMKNWVLVTPEGTEGDDQLKGWIQRVVKFVGKRHKGTAVQNALHFVGEEDFSFSRFLNNFYDFLGCCS
jgi:hypothetical protein